MKGADIIVKILIAKGVDTIFGYPGGYVLDIYESLRNHQGAIAHYTLNHEQACCFAADGYARASGKLGVVLSTSGPGACNLVTGIANSNMDSIPLLAITGNVPTYKLGSDSFQEVDILGVTMPITKYNHIVKSIEELPKKLIEAINIATNGRKGATLIDIPEDIQKGDLDISDADIQLLANQPIAKKTALVNKDLLRHAADIINDSRKIAILIGGGCSCENAQAMVRALVSELNAPIVTTLMGVQHFDYKSPNYLGLSGSYGNKTANHTLKVADTIITLGARFGDRLLATGNFKGKSIIQLDIDRAEHDKNINGVCFLRGDLAVTLAQLLPLLEVKDNSFLSSMLSYRRKVGAGSNNRTMRNMLRALSCAVGEFAPIATDVGEHQIFTAQNYCFGKTFLSSSGLGAMGYGLPAIIGANIALNPQKSLLITGDGSINMSLTELSTLAKLNLPCIVAIFNNHTLGMCYTMQNSRYGAPYMTDTPVNIPYANIAREYGLLSATINNYKSLTRILDKYDFSKPLVIDIQI